jgi:hypothetical protein
MRQEEPTPVEERLKSELQSAHDLYECAKQGCEEASRCSRDIGLNTPDGTHILFNATGEFSRCLEKYTAAVKQYADFILARATP